MITPEEFWECFGEDYPDYLKGFPNPKRIYFRGSACTDILISFLIKSTQKINSEYTWDSEYEGLDFCYKLEEKIEVAIETENRYLNDISNEINNFIKQKKDNPLFVLFWYYYLTDNTSKYDLNGQIKRLSKLVKKNKLGNLLLIIGPNPRIKEPKTVEKNFLIINGADYEAYKFNSDGIDTKLDDKEILRRL